MQAQWLITRDYISEGESKGVSSRSYKGERKALQHKFRMKDDDGNVYYHGVSDDDSAFEPLDHFGMGMAGCTCIEYQNPATKAWEIL